MRPEELTRHLNFDYYLPSSPREIEAFSQRPVYLDPDVFKHMVGAAGVLYKLVEKLVPQILTQPANHANFLLPDFPFCQPILNLPNELIPYFWARYDAFERAAGGIFFSEFNYDKPCAQREILVSDWLNPDGNPNQDFAEKFRQGLINMWKEFGSGGDHPTVGILVDPNHYEETHLAFLFADLIKPLGYKTLLLGGQNLQADPGGVSAFGQSLDIIIRQYPTEFSKEVSDYAALLQLIAERRVLILNDPRAIVPQAKSLFAYLWGLYNNHSALLTEMERSVIRDTIPYTRILTPEDFAQIEGEREQWVVKPIFGRYSEGVYIGAMMEDAEWRLALEEVYKSRVPHVLQEFVPIKRRIVSSFNGNSYEDAVGFGNFGVYFTKGEFSGICVRWSSDYLSRDELAWFTPVGVRQSYQPALKAAKTLYCETEYRQRWNETAKQLAFQFNYTASYTGEWESFTLEPLLLSPSLYQEIVDATEGLGRVFVKTRDFIQANLELFQPLLGIPETLLALVNDNQGEYLSLLGRFDWTIDKAGQLRLLEINTDTPAGLEAMALNELIHPFYPGTKDPNKNFTDLLINQLARMLNKTTDKTTKVLGLVGCPSAEEDWFQMMRMGEMLDKIVDTVVLGDISGLVWESGSLSLYGKELDAIYRYYPLEWLAEDKDLRLLIPGLERFPMINPASALIPQSKAFLAFVWQLLEQGFYLPEEETLIQRYVVPTYLSWCGKPCVIKPYWGREGQGVAFSKNIKPDDMRILAEQDFVYQNYVDINPLGISVHNTSGRQFQVVYPILGAFLAGDCFAGLYSRLGAPITNRYAVVAPTFVEV